MIEQNAAPTVTIVFEGEIEARISNDFRDRIVEAARPDTNLIVLDLSDVTFFDSSAIGGLLAARFELEARGVTILVDPCSSIVRRVMGITGLDEVFLPSPVD